MIRLMMILIDQFIFYYRHPLWSFFCSLLFLLNKIIIVLLLLFLFLGYDFFSSFMKNDSQENEKKNPSFHCDCCLFFCSFFNWYNVIWWHFIEEEEESIFISDNLIFDAKQTNKKNFTMDKLRFFLVFVIAIRIFFFLSNVRNFHHHYFNLSGLKW